jgi:hypothetical protein
LPEKPVLTAMRTGYQVNLSLRAQKIQDVQEMQIDSVSAKSARRG